MFVENKYLDAYDYVPGHCEDCDEYKGHCICEPLELCPVCGDVIDYCTGCPISDDYLNGFE